MRALIDLLRHFMTPDSHEQDPAGWLLTQAGHFGAIGAPLLWASTAMAGPGHGLVLIGAGYAIAEVAQSFVGRQVVRDAVHDWCFVMLGAAWMAGILTGDTVAAGVAIGSAITSAALGAVSRLS